ncbi:hypothetical protein [Leucobacter sp. G161]|uniref:hypothetical protein n=1 Tax=Leucobacter sp. G161 TaxID=663704 RepID=UPI00073BD39F|nr:hypothetical protein [Leucobacter sp. G161]KUF05887.1 hypothetical protein AUL38_03470 [Leucobacter sp. G161]
MSAIRRPLLAAPLALLLSLSGCVSMVFSAPATTYVDEGGETVRLNWREFPGHGTTDPQAVLDGPTVETGEARSELLLAEARAALSERFGGDWTLEAHGGEPSEWHATSNGYGGDSLLYTFNSPSSELEVRVPRDEWPEVIAIVEGVVVSQGLTERSDADLDPPYDATHRSTTFSHGGEFLDVTVSDSTLDAAALAETEKCGGPVAGISLFYGVSAIHEADRAEFERRVQPFLGQAHPSITD